MSDSPTLGTPTPWSDILPARPRRSLLAAWTLLATLNLSAGLVITSWPERRTDLETMTRWGRQWLIGGTNIYGAVDEIVDYPPHAIVALSPLGGLPDEWAVRVWTIVNLGLAVAAPYLAVRLVRPEAAGSALVLPALMFLCWGGVRTLLQFSLLTLVFGLLAMMLADRRPTLSGLCLGLALMKPQIAAPFVLWTIFTRRLRVAGIGMLVIIIGFAMFCARVGVSPIAVVQSYAETLNVRYLADEDLIMVGLAQLRPLIALAIPRTNIVNATALGIALALLVAISLIGFAEGRRDGLMVSAPPLVGVWSLLTFYHLTYGFIVLLPVATFLIFANDPATRTFRRIVFWSMQFALMVDIPGMWPRGASLVLPGRGAQAWAVPAHADRILMVALCGGLFALAVTRLKARR